MSDEHLVTIDGLRPCAPPANNMNVFFSFSLIVFVMFNFAKSNQFQLNIDNLLCYQKNLQNTTI